MIQHVSSNIQVAILEELSKANTSIKIAVAWFTNKYLLQPLIQKLRDGISVEIIINDDDINRNGDSSLDFTDYLREGGILHWNESSQLMHDKFCIIDNKVVISGSYNWTYKAEVNEETISIFNDEIETVSFYRNKYEMLVSKYSDVTKGDNIGKVKYEPQIIIKTHIKKVFKESEIKEASKRRKISQTNSLSIVSFSPLRYEPNNQLIFYDEINIFNHIIIAKRSDENYILDNRTFEPINNFCFSDYAALIDKDTNYFSDLPLLWLCCSGKWGLYNISTKSFCIPAICESFKVYGQIFKQYEIVINGRHGVADSNGYFLLDCKFDGVEILGYDLFQINNNNKYAIVNKGKLMVEFDERKFHNIVINNGEYGLIDYDGNIILDFEYDKITYCAPFGCGFYELQKDGMFGVRTIGKGARTTKCIYSSDNLPIELYSGNDIILKKDAQLI